MAQHGAAQGGTAQDSTAQHSTAQHSTAQQQRHAHCTAITVQHEPEVFKQHCFESTRTAQNGQMPDQTEPFMEAPCFFVEDECYLTLKLFTPGRRALSGTKHLVISMSAF